MCQERNQTVTLVDVFIRGYASNRGLLAYLISWGQCRSAYCSEQEKPSHVFHSRAGGPRRTEPFQLRTGGGQCNMFTIHKRYKLCSLVLISSSSVQSSSKVKSRVTHPRSLT